jgi:hypothetical protein
MTSGAKSVVRDPEVLAALGKKRIAESESRIFSQATEEDCVSLFPQRIPSRPLAPH